MIATAMTRPGSSSPRRLSTLVIAFLLALTFTSPSLGTEEPPSDPASTTEAPAWTDAEIEAALSAACDSDNRIRNYRGTQQKFDVVGPLWLAERDDERARGVVLPTFLRLYHYAHDHRCQEMEVDEARELAGPETWVVLWRVETPFRGRQSMTGHDQKILRPKEVRLRHENEWHNPVETRTRDSWMSRWFYDDWDPEESLVAVFDEVPYAGSLFVDWGLEEDGRNYLSESAIFSMHSVPKKWWALAHGEPEPKGGSWWKR